MQVKFIGCPTIGKLNLEVKAFIKDKDVINIMTSQSSNNEGEFFVATIMYEEENWLRNIEAMVEKMCQKHQMNPIGLLNRADELMDKHGANESTSYMKPKKR